MSPAPDGALIIVTGWGKSRGLSQTSDVRGRIESVLGELGVATLPTDNPGRLLVDSNPLMDER